MVAYIGIKLSLKLCVGYRVCLRACFWDDVKRDNTRAVAPVLLIISFWHSKTRNDT